MDKGNLSKIIRLRHELHRHPELSLSETGTAERIKRFLKDNTALAIEERDGWFCAVKKGTDPKSAAVAFRADMDALPIDETGSKLPYASAVPGVSHKCGHDGHSAALCALALELDRVPAERTVYLIFQGAEEIGEGAKKAALLIKEKGIREIYAFHNLSGYPVGKILYRTGLTQPSSEGVTIRFYGRQSHASAPEDGRNPSLVIARTVLRIQEFLAVPRGKMVLCTVVGMNAGNGDFGISAGEGSLMLTLRAEEEQDLKKMEKEILSFAGEEAEKEGIRTASSVTDYFPETRNSEEGLEKVLRAAGRLHLPAEEMASLWRASEDFGYYLKECSGAMFYIGNGEDWPALHTEGYDFNDRILETAVALFLEIIKEQETVFCRTDREE
ncbi:MAG: amidohydrolase [Eubacterium sp.]|nr:amidohydrolase [Eubacterium sp.]